MSGIVTFVPRGPAERVRQELWERGAVTKVRFGGLRLAPHHYQDGRDVDAFLAALDAAEGKAFYDEYAARMRAAYPQRADGTTLLPFPRIFIVAER